MSRKLRLRSDNADELIELGAKALAEEEGGSGRIFTYQRVRAVTVLNAILETDDEPQTAQPDSSR